MIATAVRAAAAPLAMLLALGTLTASPAAAAGEPAAGPAPAAVSDDAVTVEVSGTLQPVVVDSAGAGSAPGAGTAADGDNLLMLVTDDGGYVGIEPETLGEAAGVDPHQLPVGTELQGELALPDEAVEAVADAGFDVSAGDTLAAASAAAEAALAALDEHPDPAVVASATLTAPAAPALAAAAPAPSAHSVYVAVMQGHGSISGYEGDVDTAIDYWEAQGADGGLSIALAEIQEFTSDAATNGNSCGLTGGDGFADIMEEAEQVFPGVDFGTASSSTPNHLVVLVLEACADGYVGIAEVGTDLRSGGASIVAVGAYTAAALAHELGHNLSLGHADARICPNTGPCVTAGYGDLTNVMGFSTDLPGIPVLSGLQREHLGLLDEDDEAQRFDGGAGASFSADLAPRSDASGVRAAVITDTDGDDGTEYWLEYRSGTGADADAPYLNGSWPLTPDSEPTCSTSFGPGVTVSEAQEADSYGFATLLTIRRSGSNCSGTLANGSTFTTPGGLPVSVAIAGGTATVSASAPEAPITATGQPGLTGSGEVGEPLTADDGSLTWDPDTGLDFTYEWLRNGTTISGATGNTYTPVLSDVGKSITVRVRATRSEDDSTGQSDPSEPITIKTPTLTPLTQPAISGTTRPGHTLKTTRGSWRAAPGAGTVTFAYQWYRNGKRISGQTGKSYHVVPTDVGAKITVTITATASHHNPGKKTTAAVKIGKGATALTLKTKAGKRTVKVTVKLSLPGTSKAKTTGKVKVRVGSKTKTLKVVKGVGTAKFTGISPKKHAVRAAYGETKYYTKSTKSTKVTVKR